MYTRIELLKDIYEYNKEMREYEEAYRNFLKQYHKKEVNDEQKDRGKDNRPIHH